MAIQPCCSHIYMYNKIFKIQDFIHNLHSVNNTVLVEVTFTQCETVNKYINTF